MNFMKCNISLYQYWPRPSQKRFWVEYWVDRSDEGFIIELSNEQIEEINNSTLDKVHEILNLELYNQFWIAYGEK